MNKEEKAHYNQEECKVVEIDEPEFEDENDESEVNPSAMQDDNIGTDEILNDFYQQ